MIGYFDWISCSWPFLCIHSVIVIFLQHVDVAELRQKLQALESLKKELELLQRQKAASEQALNEKRRQSSGGVWGWIAGTPPNQQDDA
ncbi:hypothetical protein CQW23_20138 [Capsicum baccatum]|uniref:Acyl-CoA-binding domain-containing protein n=1 Tax=Capsicum baccatum TaxID=33114 RepID=A0A2G2W7T7_CAPBA|nr:hypothetical protein CQW23_20138 [Capsicum baccatum]